jgi:hypothetical protein
MGFGNYSQEAHEAITKARVNLPTQAVFKQTQCHPLMNPKGARMRESRDSPDHPNSFGVVFALDVTGSMGAIPEMLARQELPKFMKILQDCRVADPQLLFMAVGDATSDNAPLQVGQFESTAELMDQWLTWSYIEGNGGGQGSESYELAFYFLARHTDMDGFRKRKKRGYVFMTGDELPYPAVSRHQVETLIGDRLDEDVTTEEVVAALRETYHPFFLIPDLERRANCERRWRDLLGDHVVCMEDPRDTCFVAAGIVALNEGVVADLPSLAKVLDTAGVHGDRLGAVIRALTPLASLLGRDAVAAPAAVGSSKVSRS